jgi:hypothetical protein
MGTEDLNPEIRAAGNFTIHKLYLILCKRRIARSSSSFNESPVSSGSSSRGLFLQALSDDFFLFKGRNLQKK